MARLRQSGSSSPAFDSDNNVIEKNIVTENGPLSGISLVGDSDRNLVSRNDMHENDMTNFGVVDAAGNPVWTLGNRHVPPARRAPASPRRCAAARRPAPQA